MSVDPQNPEPQSKKERLWAQTHPEDRRLPFAKRYPILVGALGGVLLRFGAELGLPGGAMGMAFIFGVPILVGALTVYLAERVRRRSFTYYLSAGGWSVILFVLGTLLVLIEGLICAILILPLFSLFGALGGLLMGLICRYTMRPKNGLLGLTCLPVFLALLESSVSHQHVFDSVSRTVEIHATPEQIWTHLLHAPDIQTDEVPAHWLSRIGVPLVRSGEFDAVGALRRVRMDKNVYFDEQITELQQHKLLAWRYHFYPDSFPPNALDQHVVVGGEYFDLDQTRYRLDADGDVTRLHIDFSYRVSTRFNWYAAPLARWLLGNLTEANLAFYQRRAEASARASGVESAHPAAPSQRSSPE